MASTTSDPLMLSVERNRSGQGGNRSLEAAIEAEALKLAKERLSSGPYKTAQLRQMGHPYSRRRPAPPMHPAIINVQTGRFRNSWRIEARLTGTRLQLSVDNTSPEARFLLHGTRKMIARPYEQALKNLVEAAMPRIVARWLAR